MSRRQLTYNPGLLTEDELLETFIVRGIDLDLIVETIRDNDGPSNQHVVVVGARGMGKTTLVARAALAVTRDPEMRRRWTPVILGEESYEIGSVGELWLKALERLAGTVGDARWRRAYEAMSAERDEERLREGALGRLLDYARDSHSRVLLVVENVDMLLGEQIGTDDAWTLRHTLQQHPEIMLLATAIDYDGIFGRRELPLYGLAREHRLKPLTLSETKSLWTHITNEERGERALTPIHRLTGGNPRLITIVASFSTGRSFRELMDELTMLVDEHTSYFKATVEALPPAERRVYSTLADIWAPAASREVAARCRISASKASALLARLMTRGLVEEVGKEGRSKRYQVAERLYNVYHLLRSRGAEQRARVKGLVEFMGMFYESDELANVMGRLATEATMRPEDNWGEYLEIYRLLMRKCSSNHKLLEVTPEVFLERVMQLELPDTVIYPSSVALFKAAERFFSKSGKESAAGALGALATYLETDTSRAMSRLLDFLTPEDPTQADLRLSGLQVPFILRLAVGLIMHTMDDDNALRAAVRLKNTFPDNRDVLMLAVLASWSAGHFGEATIHAQAFTVAFPEDAFGWGVLGGVLESEGDTTGAITAYRRSVEKEDAPFIRLRLAAILCRLPGYEEESRMLAKTIALEEGEPDRWLEIARSESDPKRALEVAKRLVQRGDFGIAFAAMEVIDEAARMLDTDGRLPEGASKVWVTPSSPGGVAWAVYEICYILQGEDAWSGFEALLRHSWWRRHPSEMVVAIVVPVLHLSRVDRARVLRMLDSIEEQDILDPVLVALRVYLGGDVSHVPAEIVGVARDIAARLEMRAGPR